MHALFLEVVAIQDFLWKVSTSEDKRVILGDYIGKGSSFSRVQLSLELKMLGSIP